MKVHTYAWIVWLLSGLVIITTTRNPLIILLVDLVLLIIQIRLSPDASNIFRQFFSFSLSVLTLSTILNMFISRFGETILFQISEKVPLLGGNYTLEALVYGLTNGLILIGMFTLFMILNRVVTAHSLVRLIPQAFHPIAVVTTIAITFIPASQKQFQAIREAQAIRGQQLKKIRDWLPLIIPLLIGGLERAMQIAEAMTARGFTAQNEKSPSVVEKALLPMGLLLILIGWVIEISSQIRLAGWWLMGSGLMLLLLLFFVSGRRVKKTVYSEEPWTPSSTWISFISLSLMVIFLTSLPGKDLLLYDPYPAFTMPGFPILQGIAIFALFIPLVFGKGENNDSD